MGPFETIDLNAPGGIADYSARLSQLYTNIAASRSEHKPWPKDLVEKAEAERRKALPENKLPDRGEWRDRRLMALNKHKADASREIGD